MISGETRVRAYNNTAHDIGVNTVNGMSLNITPGSFKILTVNDILYIDSICNYKKFFTSGMLVAVDDTGKRIDAVELGLYPEDTGKHLTNEDIAAALKQNPKKLEAWLKDIEDEAELHSIYMVAKDMEDLPIGKIKVLKAKMPNKDWLDEL